jgi:uncharacterized lipoprotein YmbA
MKLVRLLTAAGAMALLAACATSPAVQFYTLAPVAPQQRPAHVTGAPLQVAAVHIPPALDRQEMVRRSSANELEMSDSNRWGAPLAQMVRRVITQDLDRRLPQGMVVFPDEPAPPETDAIVVDILRFDADASGAVEFVASWSLLPPGSDVPSVSRQVHFTERAEAESYADQATAMSRVLGRLADDITAALAARSPGSAS